VFGIFQEAVLPKSVEIICGQNAIPVEIMIELIQAVVNASLADWIRGDAPTLPGMWTLQLIETYERWQSVIGQHFSFSALVEMGCEWSCYDSRDRNLWAAWACGRIAESRESGRLSKQGSSSACTKPAVAKPCRCFGVYVRGGRVGAGMLPPVADRIDGH
jgi:hypothetical protein